MKNILFIALLFVCTTVSSQELRINTYANYTLSNKINGHNSPTEYYNGRIKSTYLWGAGTELVFEDMSVELKYLRGDAKAPVTHYSNLDVFYPNFDVAMNYLFLTPKAMLFDEVDHLDAYIGLNLGAAWFEFRSPVYQESFNVTHMAWGVNAGLNYWFTDRFGAKIQAELLSTINDVSIFASFGTGGAGVGVSTSSSFYQFNFGGGLICRLTSKY